MIPVEQAEKIILELVQPLDVDHETEVVSLLTASDRILAGSVTSKLDFPHWDNSAMDGYAVRYEDVKACSAESPVTLTIVEEIPAGYQPQRSLESGQAARILTGAVMPTGADTIVMQEETQREGERVTILMAPQQQALVRHRAAFYRAGDPLLSPGLRLQAPEIAVLAAAQCAQVKVYRQPRVAVLSTGDELVGIDQPLQPGQIVDSNQYALASLVAQTGAVPLLLGVVPDQPEALRAAIAVALDRADMVISSGGVSVGDYDYVEEVLTALSGTIHIRAVAIKPGKPLTVATFPQHEAAAIQRRKEASALEGMEGWSDTLETLSASNPRLTVDRPILYFGLPGNPVSALVTFWRFVQPALRKQAGLPESDWRPTFVSAKTRVDLRSDGKRETYLWGKLHLAEGHYEFDLAGGSHSSGNLINLAGTSGLAMLPASHTQVKAGESVQVLQLNT